MIRISPLIDRLIDAFQMLPGVGPKWATRMTLYVLQHNREGGETLARSLSAAVAEVERCRECRTLCETELCAVCANPRRDGRTLCVVESPADVIAIEQAGGYSGRYFVLHGRLSPIDGIGPSELGLVDFATRVRERGIREVILATNPTVEGEATAHYIVEALSGMDVRVTRIAHGVPLGGELEYIDGGTIAHALHGRRAID